MLINKVAHDLWRQKRKLVLALLFVDEDIEAKRNRTVWTRSWIKRRNERGAFHQVVQETLTEDEPAFQNYFRKTTSLTTAAKSSSARVLHCGMEPT